MDKIVNYDSKYISDKSIKRINKYLRILKNIREEKSNINSNELAEKMNITSSQVRKDLSTFGEFGVRSKGYDIDSLIKTIEYILGIDKLNELILIGHGNMGNIFSHNLDMFGEYFKLVGIFEKDKNKIGTIISGIEIKNIEEVKEFITNNNINSCILAVDKEYAQETSELLVSYGIKAILNLTGKLLNLPQNIAVTEIDFLMKLQEMNFWKKYNQISEKKNKI